MPSFKYSIRVSFGWTLLTRAKSSCAWSPSPGKHVFTQVNSGCLLNSPNWSWSCWAKLSRSRLLMFSCQANCHLFFPLWCVFIYVKCNPKRVDYLMASEGSSYLFLRFSSKGFNLWPFTLNASPVFGFLTSIAPHEDIVWTMYGFIHLVRSFPRNMRRRELYKSTFCPERFFAKLLCHAWPWCFPCKALYSQMLHFLSLQVHSTTVSSQYRPIGYTYSISWQPNRPCAQLP